jgi:hypothetical protein
VMADDGTVDDTANAISGRNSMFRTDLFKGKRFRASAVHQCSLVFCRGDKISN